MLLVFFLASASSSLLELPNMFKDFSAIGATATMVRTTGTTLQHVPVGSGLPLPAANPVVSVVGAIILRTAKTVIGTAVPIISPILYGVEMATNVISTCSLLKSAYNHVHGYFTTDQEDEKQKVK